MKINPGDQPKIIALVVAIVLFLGFGVFRLMGSLNKPAATPPGQTGAAPTNHMPSTAQIATGQVASAQPVVGQSTNLHELFAGTNDGMPVGNPFRLPVPVPRTGDSNSNRPSTPVGTSTVQGAQDVTQPRGIGGSVEPYPVDPNDTSGGGAAVAIPSIRIKGIIAPQDGSAALVLVQLNDRTRSFRAGEEVAPGIKILSIAPNAVRVKIGAATTTAGVGQEVKPV